MFPLMYVGLAPSRLERGQLAELIDEFVPHQPFGLIPFEVRRYINQSALEENFYDPDRLGIDLDARCYKKYAATPEWQLFSRCLLQATGGDSGTFLHSRVGKRNRLSLHVTGKTKILAGSGEAAISRIFFEIDEFFPQMVERRDVAKGCGYGILKRIYGEEKRLGTEIFMSAEDLLEFFGYAKANYWAMQDWYIRTKLNPLKDGDVGLLIERNGKFGITDLARVSFSLLDANRDEMRRFTCRVQWFYPMEKSRGVLAERTDREVISLK